MREMPKRPKWQLYRKVLTVTLTENVSSGYGEFDVSKFKKGKEYRVFGACYITYKDRSGVACWIVEDENGIVQPKAMHKFKVAKVEGED